MDIRESSWQRARKDLDSIRHSTLFFLLFEVVGLAAFGLLGSLLTPHDSSDLAKSLYPFVGAVLGALFAYGLLFLWNLFRAPYRQRNEAYSALLAVPGATQHSPKQAPQEIHIVLRQSTVLYPSEGHSHYPKERKDGARIPLLRTSIDISATEETSITAVSLDLLGSLIPSIEWKIYKFSAATLATSFGTTVYFQLPQSIARGTHTAKLQAFADGAWWASRPFDFTVPAPPTSDTSGSQP